MPPNVKTAEHEAFQKLWNPIWSINKPRPNSWAEARNATPARLEELEELVRKFTTAPVQEWNAFQKANAGRGASRGQLAKAFKKGKGKLLGRRNYHISLRVSFNSILLLKLDGQKIEQNPWFSCRFRPCWKSRTRPEIDGIAPEEMDRKQRDVKTVGGCWLGYMITITWKSRSMVMISWSGIPAAFGARTPHPCFVPVTFIDRQCLGCRDSHMAEQTCGCWFLPCWWFLGNVRFYWSFQDRGKI